MIYDYVAGYVRRDNWNSGLPNPGINGISIWDLRRSPPVALHVAPSLGCDMYRLDPMEDYVPTADDFSGYKFAELAYHSRALAEKWMDAEGNYVFLDVFSRDVVGMGNVRNMSDPDSQALDYTITDWSDKVPDGSNFMLPNTLKCVERNSTSLLAGRRHEKRSARKCNGCKDAMKKKIKDMCQSGKTPEQVCREQRKPVTPDCIDGITNSCVPGALTPEGMCKFMHIC